MCAFVTLILRSAPCFFAVLLAIGGLGEYNSGMKTCLGTLLLVPIIVALVGTVAYHASVNQEVRFEQRDSDEVYINTQRSYRPPTHIATQKPKPEQLQDDDTAEEVSE